MRERGTHSPLRWLAVIVVGLTTCFVASTIYSQRLAASIDALTSEIATNGAASVVCLAEIRHEARLVERRISLSRADTAVDDRVAIRAELAAMNAAVQSYLALAVYPGERALQEAMIREQHAFEAAVESALASLGQGGVGARQALGAREEAFDASIRALVDLNATEVTSGAAQIRRRRADATVMAYELDVATALLGGAAFALATSGSRRYARLLDERNRMAEERARELEMFAARVAHDLRTPITAIQLRAAAAEASPTPGAAEQALARIGVQTRRMAAIIDALLAFARAGARPEPGARCEVREVIGAVVGDIQPLAAAAEVSLIVEPIASARARCSPDVLSIVLSNLVRNAIKYIGERSGERRVTLRANPRADFVRLEVDDTGPGLPPGAQDVLFREFVQLARSPLSGSGGGVGLGLATVKRLVDAHGGKVGVSSAPGVGCRFWVELPAA